MDEDRDQTESQDMAATGDDGQENLSDGQAGGQNKRKNQSNSRQGQDFTQGSLGGIAETSQDQSGTDQGDNTESTGGQDSRQSNK
jgi:hypothetical protein